MPIVGLE